MNSKLGNFNDQGNQKGFGQYEKHQRCELCNVPIFRNPCHDVRSSGVFHGKGKILCNKCVAELAKMPAAQALHALDNASDSYKKD